MFSKHARLGHLPREQHLGEEAEEDWHVMIMIIILIISFIISSIIITTTISNDAKT